MSVTPSLQHVAIHCSNRKHADIFFTKILDLTKIKQFSLSADMSLSIFGVDKHVDIDVYGNDSFCIEVFCIENQHPKGFSHLCIRVNNRAEFIQRCEQYKLSPYTVQKDGKEYLFVRDFSNNLYEIKGQ